MRLREQQQTAMQTSTAQQAVAMDERRDSSSIEDTTDA